ncbi:hypothetical protein NIES208_11800 [[Limnothrix rosea] IAM M-220]|nr:hypothetical protein NIES208_11800 [[Limnothrix rosea] IAM M-220]
MEKTQNTQSVPESLGLPCTVSGVFDNRDEAGQVLRQLLDMGISRDNISMIGKNLQSETQITGFVGRSDVIKDGLQSGAIFGALFGTVISALSGFGILFVPFVGTVVAGGPLGAALLGATSGAIAGSAGAGIVSALASLGLPKEKAAIYETKIKEGGLMITAEVDSEMSADVEQLFREQGGDEILSCNDFLITRFDTGRVSSTSDLPESVKSRLSPEAQERFVEVFNQTYASENSENAAAYRAWMTIEDEFDQNDKGVWAIAKAPSGSVS